MPQNCVLLASVFVFAPRRQTNKKLDVSISGYPPFYDDNPFGIYEKILSGKLEWPRHVEMTAKDLVKRLLVQVEQKNKKEKKTKRDKHTKRPIVKQL